MDDKSHLNIAGDISRCSLNISVAKSFWFCFFAKKFFVFWSFVFFIAKKLCFVYNMSEICCKKGKIKNFKDEEDRIL